MIMPRRRERVDGFKVFIATDILFRPEQGYATIEPQGSMQPMSLLGFTRFDRMPDASEKCARRPARSATPDEHDSLRDPFVLDCKARACPAIPRVEKRNFEVTVARDVEEWSVDQARSTRQSRCLIRPMAVRMMKRRFGRDDLTLVRRTDERSRSPTSRTSGRQMYSPGKIDLIQERLIGAEARGAAPSLRQSKILPPQALGVGVQNLEADRHPGKVS